MSSTTIRHSGVPENSDSRDSDLAAKWRARLRDHRDEPSEPDHLRHKTGDDWIVDRNRPHDPLDPGPYGTPGWTPDLRTGRHRRGELPDPLPVEDQPEPTAPQQTQRDQLTRRDDDPPSPNPRQQRSRRNPEFERDRDRDRDRDRRNPTNRTLPGDTEHRFSKLREQAFDRFMIESAELRAAHFEPTTPYLRERALWMLRCLLTILTCGLVPTPGPLTGCKKRKEAHAPQRLPQATVNSLHWRTVPRQHRPRPTYQPSSYITAWEQAFDNTTLPLGGAA